MLCYVMLWPPGAKRTQSFAASSGGRELCARTTKGARVVSLWLVGEGRFSLFGNGGRTCVCFWPAVELGCPRPVRQLACVLRVTRLRCSSQGSKTHLCLILLAL